MHIPVIFPVNYFVYSIARASLSNNCTGIFMEMAHFSLMSLLMLFTIPVNVENYDGDDDDGYSYERTILLSQTITVNVLLCNYNTFFLLPVSVSYLASCAHRPSSSSSFAF